MSTLTNNFEIGEQIRVLRRRRKLTQSELSGLCGISERTLSRVESGSMLPQVSTLVRIIDALDGVLRIEDQFKDQQEGIHDGDKFFV